MYALFRGGFFDQRLQAQVAGEREQALGAVVGLLEVFLEASDVLVGQSQRARPGCRSLTITWSWRTNT